jgi:hypothetical protein
MEERSTLKIIHNTETQLAIAWSESRKRKAVGSGLVRKQRAESGKQLAVGGIRNKKYKI